LQAVPRAVGFSKASNHLVGYPNHKNSRKKNQQVSENQPRKVHPDHGRGRRRTSAPQWKVAELQAGSASSLEANRVSARYLRAARSRASLPEDRRRKKYNVRPSGETAMRNDAGSRLFKPSAGTTANEKF